MGLGWATTSIYSGRPLLPPLPLLVQMDTALGLWARLSFSGSWHSSPTSAWPPSTEHVTATVWPGETEARTGILALVALPDCDGLAGGGWVGGRCQELLHKAGVRSEAQDAQRAWHTVGTRETAAPESVIWGPGEPRERQGQQPGREGPMAPLRPALPPRGGWVLRGSEAAGALSIGLAFGRASPAHRRLITRPGQGWV